MTFRAILIVCGRYEFLLTNTKYGVCIEKLELGRQKMSNGTTEKTLKERVIRVIAEQLGVNENNITLETDLLGDLGADSLDMVETIMAIEAEFKINIPDEEAIKTTTVQEIINNIEEKLLKKSKWSNKSPCMLSAGLLNFTFL